MSSEFSHFASNSDGGGAEAEASMPAQFASANMDDLCFDENTALLREPTPGASEASPGLPCLPWSSWCLADQPGLVGAVAFPAPQDVPPGQPNAVPVSYVNEYDYNANPLDYSTWVNPIALPAPEPLSPTGSPAPHGWPRATPTETGYRRRNPHSDQHSPPQFTKKMEGALSLQAEVQRLEGENKVLTSNRAKLVQEGHYFKILLLQHAKCKCVLIQNYIAGEAQRYIGGIRQGAFPGHVNGL